MPLMVLILKSTEYINNLVRCSIWKYKNFSYTLNDQRYAIKAKIVPVLNLIKYYAVKAYGGVDV
jgi:hypothetical protein